MEGMSAAAAPDAPPRALLRWGRMKVAWIDRQVPVAVKLVVPLLALVVLIASGYAIVAVPSLERELESAYAAEARTVAGIVALEYAAHNGDRATLNAFVQDRVRLDPSIVRIRVYRRVEGVPTVWASSEPSELTTYRPRPHDIEPLTTGSGTQEVELVEGARLLETVRAVLVDGRVDASVGVYSSLDAADAAVAEVLRLVAIAALVGGLLLALAMVVVLEVIVLRPIDRLHRAALRVAAGDLTVRLPEGALPSARDEIASIAREFDRMVRVVADQRADVERLAATDGLTGLLNRRSFDDRLRIEADRARRLGYPLVVSLVDLDGFKKLNDSRGHLAGDDALRRVADALAAAVRGSDVLARYGGDEFAIIQPGCDVAVAAVVGKRLRAAVERLDLVADSRPGRLLTASVGAAPLRSERGAVDALAEADAALYRAKARGGGVEIAVATEPRGSAGRSVRP